MSLNYWTCSVWWKWPFIETKFSFISQYLLKYIRRKVTAEIMCTYGSTRFYAISSNFWMPGVKSVNEVWTTFIELFFFNFFSWFHYRWLCSIQLFSGSCLITDLYFWDKNVLLHLSLKSQIEQCVFFQVLDANLLSLTM